jgi:hypothetical protein
MPNRSRLHELVDSLPEAALAVAQGALERFQTWPPKKPAQLAAIDKANMDRMLRSTGPMLASGGGTQSYDMGHDWLCGRFSSSWPFQFSRRYRAVNRQPEVDSEVPEKSALR